MKRGPKPRPSNLRVIEGNIAGSNPLNQREPKPPLPPVCPPAPAWLEKLAQEVWREVAPQLWQTGTLAEIDVIQLAAYCEVVARYRLAYQDFRKISDVDDGTHGAIMRTKSGNHIQNPLLGVLNVARRDMLRIAAEFGMTASARTTIEALEGGGNSSAAIAHKYGLR
jgi:P27 family predicted phage terminase small subunit